MDTAGLPPSLQLSLSSNSQPVRISSNLDWPTTNAVALKTFSAAALNIPPGTVKIDTLIAGFEYGSTNNQFNIRVAPQGAVLQSASNVVNAYNDPGVTSTPFTGFFSQNGGNITFPYVITFETAAITSFSELVITLVVHSVAFPSGSQSPVSTGFNTMTVNRQTSYINLFNPIYFTKDMRTIILLFFSNIFMR